MQRLHYSERRDTKNPNQAKEEADRIANRKFVKILPRVLEAIVRCYTYICDANIAGVPRCVMTRQTGDSCPCTL